VGESDNGNQEPVVAELSGGSWHQENPALPADAATGGAADAFLDSVSCTGPGTCTAVGHYLTTGGAYYGLVEQQAAGWTAYGVPGAAGAKPDPDVDLEAVSCSSGLTCQAVGDYAATDGSTQPLLVTIGSAGVAATQGPLPPTTAAGTALHAVSCLSATSCVAVGRHQSAPGAPVPLVESLTNTGWSALALPTPSGQSNDGYVAVATDLHAAVAVGRFTDSLGHTQGLIAVDLPRG
jgi:hypothetical protein